MYTPSQFAVDDETAAGFLSELGAADLVTVTENGMVATFLPLLFVPEGGEHGALLGHLARKNDQWRRPAAGDALVIAHGTTPTSTAGTRRRPSTARRADVELHHRTRLRRADCA